jgi:hypothetical protein
MSIEGAVTEIPANFSQPFLPELRRQCAQLFGGSWHFVGGGANNWAHSHRNSTRASFRPIALQHCVQLFQKWWGSCAAGRIAVTVRPIACVSAGDLPLPSTQLGALSPQFGSPFGKLA